MSPATPAPGTQHRDALLADLLEELIATPADRQQERFEAIVTGHPQLAPELRELWAIARMADDLASIDPEISGLPAVRAEGPVPEGPRASVPFTGQRIIGDYDLIEELGRGGMGIVYRARQRDLHRDVALKMILRGELATPADVVRFRREAEAVARLDHPHIVRVYEVGEFEDQPYFSMQYVDGVTLARRLSDGPLPPREAARLLIPVCRAIAHAHRQGLLHRDLKPSNVLIDGSGQPYVTDFGLAKRVPTLGDHAGDEAEEARGAGGRSLGPLTASGTILGTPGYMAPEQAVGFRGSVGPQTDVYSLGAILYAMLTGRAPFQAASPVDVVLMVLEQDPPPPRVLNPQADPDLELIALKALQKPTDLRYATADDLADDLEAYLNHETIAARSSHFSQILSRALRPTHHVRVLQNWGLLWMWHACALLVLCVLTNLMQWEGVTSRLPYLGLWIGGLGAWAVIFWSLRRRSGPVTFVERQIAHVWAASMACSTLLYLVEALLNEPVLTLSPVLPLIAGAVFVVKAGILSGEFYLHAALLFATCIPMTMFPRFGLTIFGVVSALTFFIPGWKFHRQRLREAA